MKRAAGLLTLACLAGCAAQPSYVAGVGGGSDASILAYGAANLIAVKTRDGRPIALVPVMPSGDPVSPALADVFRVRHVAVAGPSQAGAHMVRYAVLPIEDVMVVSVTVDGIPVSQAFARSRHGWLEPAAPMFCEIPVQDATP